MPELTSRPAAPTRAERLERADCAALDAPVLAETDLETKARALATCAPAEQANPSKHWRDQPELMAFLHGL